jgi:hypothetical protein
MIEEASIVRSPDERAWLLTSADFHGNESAYAWNEWEKQSLEAADTDEEWRNSIVQFWDGHFPVLMSVKSGYAYWALEHRNCAVVCGEEPEYEEPSPLARSGDEMLELLVRRDPRIDRWV